MTGKSAIVFRVISVPLFFLFLFLLQGCSTLKDVKRQSISPDSLRALADARLGFSNDLSPYLKAHMKNGSLYVLQDWKIDDSKKIITGSGKKYDAYRNLLSSGTVEMSEDSVAIFETNTLVNSGSVTALTVFTGITAAVTVFCIINPKACFGSCPTFYTRDSDTLRLQAEGFSSSISPSMEATDIDALYHSKVDCDEYSLEMRNEAMETHVVRSANLLCVEKSKKNSRVFCSPDGKFWQCDSIILPQRALGPEGDCLSLLQKADGIERFSVADSANLGEKEFIELDFKNVPGKNSGLILGCRQTLLSTYLLYQTFAYMGSNAAYWVAQIERNKINVKGNEMLNMLGGIEVQVQDLYGNWQSAGFIDEFGPLATDFHIVPIKGIPEKNTKVRLKMTKGYWRIDYAALSPVSEAKNLTRLQPEEVLKGGKTDENARKILCDSSRALVTLPGDTYELKYRIPSMFKDYELFLESRGYYLEWIRREWMKEENAARLAEILLNPEAALKRLAPEFKKVEPKMESSFWRSRYAKP
ncbi:MAG: hypothetical protein HF314_03315 [Ignavibacteria bacterium]|jgi:hypothetical protein|nr:hypothetical protein [Ignavibacteria bacterium]MCU7502079.1 hypothetical protein [Ignavibacteria bacterium]MCU7515481.1 hypothetical protein [Ignavibacteria bacterium]